MSEGQQRRVCNTHARTLARPSSYLCLRSKASMPIHTSTLVVQRRMSRVTRRMGTVNLQRSLIGMLARRPRSVPLTRKFIRQVPRTPTNSEQSALTIPSRPLGIEEKRAERYGNVESRPFSNVLIEDTLFKNFGRTPAKLLPTRDVKVCSARITQPEPGRKEVIRTGESLT